MKKQDYHQKQQLLQGKFMVYITILSIMFTQMIMNVYSAENMALKDCINYAIANSVDAKKSALDQKQTLFQIGEARSNGLPQINAFGSLDMNPSIPTQLLPGELLGMPGEQIPVQFGTKFNINGGVEVSQLVYSQQFISGLKLAKSSASLYDMLAIKTEEDLIYNVSSAYYQILQMQQQAKTIEDNLERLDKLGDMMKVQMENDLINKVDYQRITVNIINLKTQQETFNAGIMQQKNYLKLLMGMNLSQDIKLVELESEQFKHMTEPTLEDPNFSNRTDMQILEKQQELTMLEIESQKAGYLPSLSAYGRYSYQAQRAELDVFDGDQPWFKIATIGLQLNIPVFDGLQKHYKTEQIKIKQEKLSLDIENTKAFMEMEHSNANTQLISSFKSVSNQLTNVSLAEEVYNQTNELYKEGVAPLTDLLEAETALREAKTGYNSEVLKYCVAQLDALKAQGNLTSLKQ